MKKENIALISIAILILITGIVFGLWRKEKIQQEKDQTIKEISKKAEEEKTFVVEKVPENKKEKQEEPKEFILPDMNQDNWETYTDKNWGFSIKFPKEFYYRVHPQGETYPGEECPTCGNGGQLLIISDQEEMGIQDYGLNENVHVEVRAFKLQSNFKNGESWEEYLNNSKDIHKSKFNGMDVFANIRGEIDPLFFLKDEWIYSVSCADIKQEKPDDSYKIMDAIKKTFKFTK